MGDPDALPTAVPLACGRDLPLIIETGADRETVGQVRAHARIDVLERGDRFATVRVRSWRIAHSEGGRDKLLREADLAECVPSPKEPNPASGDFTFPDGAFQLDRNGTTKEEIDGSREQYFPWLVRPRGPVHGSGGRGDPTT